MRRQTNIDYAAVNARDVILHTFSDAAKGRAWVRDNAALHTGLHLREVTVTTISRRVYAPPAVRRQRDDFAIPAMAGAGA